MLLTENEARTICEKLLSYVKADDATVSVNSENYGHLRFAANAFTTSGARKHDCWHHCVDRRQAWLGLDE